MKITLEPHYRWHDRTVMLVEGSADEIDEVFDWVTENRRALRASPFWIRGLKGWCEIHHTKTGLVKYRFL